MSESLDSKALNELNEIDHLNREAQVSLQEFKERISGVYRLHGHARTLIPLMPAKSDE